MATQKAHITKKDFDTLSAYVEELKAERDELEKERDILLAYLQALRDS